MRAIPGLAPAATALLALLVLGVPFEPWLPAAAGGVTWQRVVGAAFVGCALGAAGLPRPWPPGSAAFAGFGVLAAVTGLWAREPRVSAGAAATLASLVTLYAVAGVWLRRPEARGWAGRAAAAGAAALAAGIAVHYLRVVGLPEEAQPRRYGLPPGDANEQARLVLLGLLVAVAGAGEARGSRAGAVAFAALAGPVLWVLGSRGALLAGAAAGVALAAGDPCGRRTAGAAVVAAGLAAAAAGAAGLYTPAVEARATLAAAPDLGEATSGRDAIWTIGLEMARRAPTGVGYGNFPIRYDELRDEMGMEGRTRPGRDAHSIYLQALAETGPLGLALLLGGLGALLRALWRAEPGRARAVGLALLAFAAVSGATTPQLPRKSFWLALAAASARVGSREDRGQEPEPRAPRERAPVGPRRRA